jgi:putative two-component system response regulator
MTEDILSSFRKRFNYTGIILAGPYSKELKHNLSQAIVHLEALERIGSPIIPYIAAWRPDDEHIWYEYTGLRLHSLLGLKTTDLADAFRANIITRCLYRNQKNPPAIDKIIRNRSQIDIMRNSMRRVAERSGAVEAVYKIEANNGPVWLKDLARIEIHNRDGVVLSYGSLIDVTKEMLLEEKLIEVQSELSFHKENLEFIVIERTKELRKAQLDVVSRLAHAAAYRDGETGAHIKRLSQYCGILGRSFGLSKKANWALFHAVPMHDVGKLGIDDSILRKPGPLSSNEFEIIKTHCQVGADLLGGSDSFLLTVAKTIALSHHERWDGSGYPQGLTEWQIPLASRITSICDVFDALTSKRPYKRAWDFEDAVSEVTRLRSIYFDPKLVDLFMENLPKIKKIFQTNTA